MSLGEKPATAEDELMKIGELAKAAHTQVETIRYYEREGLLPETARTDGNYRMYAEEHVDRLSFIRHCRGLDMTLDEIRVLLRFKDAPQVADGYLLLHQPLEDFRNTLRGQQAGGFADQIGGAFLHLVEQVLGFLHTEER